MGFHPRTATVVSFCWWTGDQESTQIKQQFTLCSCRAVGSPRSPAMYCRNSMGEKNAVEAVTHTLRSLAVEQFNRQRNATGLPAFHFAGHYHKTFVAADNRSS